MSRQVVNEDYSKYDFKDPEDLVFKSQRGFTRATVLEISAMKHEPEWMKNIRLESIRILSRAPHAQLGRRFIQDRFC